MNRAIQALARLDGKARAKALSAERRRAIARKGGIASGRARQRLARANKSR